MKAASGRYCVISGGDHETSEQRLIDLADPDAPLLLIAAREEGVQYAVADRGDELFILTNADKAIDFKIVTAPLASPARNNWRDLIPHRAGTYVIEHDLYAGHLVRLERANALAAIVIRDLRTGEEHAIAFDEAAYSLDILGSYEFDTTTLRFNYSSMTTPSEIYDYDMASRTRTLRKRQEIPSGHNPADYVTTRIMATVARRRRGADLDPASPRFQTRRQRAAAALRLRLLWPGDVRLLQRQPPVAGRSRLRLRHRAYPRRHRQGLELVSRRQAREEDQQFDDFAACARALIAANYTGAKRIVGHGASAGGMLMGAVANRAGELFSGIVAEVPFVDVLNTMLDHSLPLTPPEWPEWGNPTVSEQDFRTILSYSPYDNVAARHYPAILAMGGLTDPRVTYWEPAKWVARLRATMASGGPVLLRTNMGAGHGGASGRFDRLDEIAIVYAFALWAAGLAEA